MARRPLLHLVLPAALIALLGVLATFQYRWLGQVSEAERERMRETLSARATTLAEDLDRELTRLFLLFQLREPQDGAAAAHTLTQRFQAWTKTSRFPDLLDAIYVVPPDGSSLSLRQLDTASGALEDVAWPEALVHMRERRGAGQPGMPGSLLMRMPPLVLNRPLAVAVPLALIEQRMVGDVFETRLLPDHGYVLLLLDDAYVRGEVIPALVRQHFPDDLSDYRIAVIDPRRPENAVYSSDGSKLVQEEADITAGMLSLRFGLADRIISPEVRSTLGLSLQMLSVPRAPLSAPGREGSGPGTERVTVFVEQRAADGGGTRTASTRLAMATPGTWQLLIKHRAGSLEAAVARVRTRNLIMSFGMLTLLAVSVGLVLVSARRAERLAAQQMDFVATVSHELRTPLAVIRSAGENLAAGVVHDPEQTRRYGELIDGEGRRLTEMVEQTLALAGLSGARTPLARQPIDVADVVRTVLASPETPASAAGVEVELRIAPDLPVVFADEVLLRRAVQNLVGNALKYARAGGWLGVDVEAGSGRRGREVRITVSDRGPGIDPRDLPYIFEAFYRGQRALADQVQGNGLGLNLVKRIADAHGGRVTVRSSPGAGASFTLHLPARRDLLLQPVGGQEPLHS